MSNYPILNMRMRGASVSRGAPSHSWEILGFNGVLLVCVRVHAHTCTDTELVKPAGQYGEGGWWQSVGKENFVAIRCWYIKSGEATIFCQYSNSKPIQIPNCRLNLIFWFSNVDISKLELVRTLTASPDDLKTN